MASPTITALQAQEVCGGSKRYNLPANAANCKPPLGKFGRFSRRPIQNTELDVWDLFPILRTQRHRRLHSGHRVPSDVPSGEYTPLASEEATHGKRNPTGPQWLPTPLCVMTLERQLRAQGPLALSYDPQFQPLYPLQIAPPQRDHRRKTRTGRIVRCPGKPMFPHEQITIPQPPKTCQIARGASIKYNHAGLHDAKKLAP